MSRFPVLRALFAALVGMLWLGAASAQQLRVAVTSAAENAPFFSAMEHGTFSKLGLDVKVDVMRAASRSRTRSRAARSMSACSARFRSSPRSRAACRWS